MTIFAILLPSAQPKLADKIATEFALDHMKISDTQWIVSARGLTTVDVCNRLGISDGTIGQAIVFATSSYFGRAPATVWEWLKTKLESPSLAQTGS